MKEIETIGINVQDSNGNGIGGNGISGNGLSGNGMSGNGLEPELTFSRAEFQKLIDEAM